MEQVGDFEMEREQVFESLTTPRSYTPDRLRPEPSAAKSVDFSVGLPIMPTMSLSAQRLGSDNSSNSGDDIAISDEKQYDHDAQQHQGNGVSHVGFPEEDSSGANSSGRPRRSSKNSSTELQNGDGIQHPEVKRPAVGFQMDLPRASSLASSKSPSSSEKPVLLKVLSAPGSGGSIPVVVPAKYRADSPELGASDPNERALFDPSHFMNPGSNSELDDDARDVRGGARISDDVEVIPPPPEDPPSMFENPEEQIEGEPTGTAILCFRCLFTKMCTDFLLLLPLLV